MKASSVLTIFLFFIVSASAQRTHIGIFGGVSAYNGDLVDRYFPKKVTNGAIGVTVNYELRDQIMLRGGFTYSVVGGADRYNDKPELVIRNLSFESVITELSLVGEYYINNLYDRRYSPYVFAGLAVYHFNPYTYYGNNKVFLKPLSTEGEGLAAYPDRKPYSLTQLAIPIGGGFKFVLTDKWHVGLEVGLRKLFNDHLDDVSAEYIDPNDLLAAKGQLAVDLSYRGDEIAGGSPTYPGKGNTRGNPKYNDWYYFFGVHLTYRIGGSNGGNGGGGLLGRNKKYGCPKVPQ